MRILIVGFRGELFPVGIAYISAVLKRAGHAVDCRMYEGPGDLRARLERAEYDIVATGGLYFQFPAIKEVSDVAKSRGLRVLVGGGIVTAEPEAMTRALNADFSVISEGEETVVELMSCLETGGDLSAVAGIGYFRDGGFIFTGARKAIEDLDALPFPDYESFEYERHLDTVRASDHFGYEIFDRSREYPIVTSRSCPFRCTFCFHPIGDAYRQRSLDSIMEELRRVIPKYRINIVSILDELFSYDEERVLEFCRRFKELTSAVGWEVRWACQMRVAGLKEGMLDAMRDAGCFVVSYGLESYHPAVLRSMKKHITPAQIDRAIEATLDRRISIQGNFIFGDRAETMETALTTLEFWRRHTEAGILLGFVLPCPDSELYRYCLAKGIIRDKVDFFSNHPFDVYNMTDMPEGEFLKLRAVVARYMLKHSPYVVPAKTTPDSVTARCPHCGTTVTYGNYVLSDRLYVKLIYCRSCRRRFFIVSRIYRFLARLGGIVMHPLLYGLFIKTRAVWSRRGR